MRTSIVGVVTTRSSMEELLRLQQSHSGLDSGSNSCCSTASRRAASVVLTQNFLSICLRCMAIVLKLRCKVFEISRVVKPFQRRTRTSCSHRDNDVPHGMSTASPSMLTRRCPESSSAGNGHSRPPAPAGSVLSMLPSVRLCIVPRRPAVLGSAGLS